MTQPFVYIWTYRIAPEHRAAFLAAYNPSGEWAQLFSRDRAYLHTQLLQDADDANRYVTLDFWTTQAARDAFRKQYADEFEALDGRCENYTIDETFLGDFTNLPAASDVAETRN